MYIVSRRDNATHNFVFYFVQHLVTSLHGIVNYSGTMGSRKFRLTKRKYSEKKRLKSRMLKTIKGRPSKQQKYTKRSVPNEVGKIIILLINVTLCIYVNRFQHCLTL